MQDQADHVTNVAVSLRLCTFQPDHVINVHLPVSIKAQTDLLIILILIGFGVVEHTGHFGPNLSISCQIEKRYEQLLSFIIRNG